VRERDAFLKALAENEDDHFTRGVYTDWLDENGEHEEAERQRQWPAAKAWLVKFCKDHNPPEDDDDPDNYPIPYKELLERARRGVEETDREELSFHCGRNETMCFALRYNKREFWKNWSIVTGIPVSEDRVEKGGFSCAC
jgi:uncharacterized protein (TIGR02996 family)